MFLAKSLYLSPAFYTQLPSLYGPVPGWYIRLVYTTETVCDRA